MVLAGYSLPHIEVQSFELILEEINNEIVAENNSDEKKLFVKILLAPGLIVKTTLISRNTGESAGKVILAMQSLSEKKLGVFVETPRAGSTLKHFQKLDRETVETSVQLTRTLAKLVNLNDYYISLVKDDTSNEKMRYWFIVFYLIHLCILCQPTFQAKNIKEIRTKTRTKDFKRVGLLFEIPGVLSYKQD